MALKLYVENKKTKGNAKLKLLQIYMCKEPNLKI